MGDDNIRNLNLSIMECNNYCITELSLSEQKEINGGNPILALVAGAIIGGFIYDAYKYAYSTLAEVQINHPEYYDGAVHSRL
jgi:hypothetical protein